MSISKGCLLIGGSLLGALVLVFLVYAFGFSAPGEHPTLVYFRADL